MVADVYLSLINIVWDYVNAHTDYIMIPGSEIQISDNGNGTDSKEKVPYYEIVWGLRPSGDQVSDGFTPFIFARKWDRYGDPDMLSAFRGGVIQSYSVYSSSLDKNGTNTIKEGIEFGVQQTSPYTSNASMISFLACQMSRSFLIFEPCYAEDYTSQSDLGVGISEFVEMLRVEHEPQFNFLRDYNGGQMSPMSPATCRTTPQVIDGGIELSFRGRSFDNVSFDYFGESRFPVRSIFGSPVKDGWRSPAEKLTFSVTSENTSSTFNNDKLPTYEITVSSQDGINPEAVSLFRTKLIKHKG